MARTDTFVNADYIPWSPLSVTASIFPALVAPAQDDVGTAIVIEVGGPRPFGLDLELPEPEARA